MHATYLFKLFVHRFAYTFHRPRYFGKYLIGAAAAVYSRLKEQTPTDNKYFRDKGWLDEKAKYFSGNVRGNVFKSLVARLMAGIMGRQIDKALSRSDVRDASPP
jgi:hypothetical protein